MAAALSGGGEGMANRQAAGAGAAAANADAIAAAERAMQELLVHHLIMISAHSQSQFADETHL